uniref:Uncharacterized protein n=1 Tax=Oryza rufipogon TaxID=4529 RepID=A0A0E0QFX3_ORYRU
MILFISRYPDSDLRTAKDGQCMKVTGVVTYGNFPLESSFQRVPRCLYIGLACMSTAYRGWINLTWNSGQWRMQTAIILPNINPAISHFPCYDCGDMLSISTFLISNLDGEHWSEKDMGHGYIEEGSRVCIMGVVQRNDNVLMIVHPSEPISTGTKIHQTC